MKNEALLKVHDLSVAYQSGKDTVCAVNGISFELKRGQTLGIVGETGAGKTTTALSILRLLPERTGRILSGTIEFDGSNLLEMTPADMRAVRGVRISMIFQDPMTSLNPVQPVGKQIAEALILHNSEGRSANDISARVDEILELVGIPSKRKNEYPHQFSGGMKQRVVIAIALACNPELLIADEPTTALDVTIQAQVLAMMQELRDKLNMAMIMITHDLGVVAATCDNVAIMYAGELIEIGTAEQIFESKNHHPYTQGLFQSIPDISGDAKRLNPIKGLMPDPTQLPKGCKFHPRCPKCMDICKAISPHAIDVDGHIICCHCMNNNKEVTQ